MYKQVKITRKLFKYYFKTIQIILIVYTYLQKKKKDHPSSIALISTICKAKTLKKANKANQSKLNYVTNEKILGEIKSDMANKVNIETTCNNSSEYGNTIPNICFLFQKRNKKYNFLRNYDFQHIY